MPCHKSECSVASMIKPVIACLVVLLLTACQPANGSLEYLHGLTGHRSRSSHHRLASFHERSNHTHEHANYTFQQTCDMVQGMAREAAKPSNSWVVRWEELADGSETAGQACSHAAQGDTAGPLLTQLLSCMDEAYEPEHRFTWEDVTNGVLANLKVAAAWWHSEEQPKLQATVVTFSSSERLHQLRAQCLSWQGPLAVLLYVPLVQPDSSITLTDSNRATLRLAVLKAMHLAMEMQTTQGACQLSLMLAYEKVADQSLVLLYPLNSMRNLARLMVRTPMSILLDVDMLPSKSLYTRLSEGKKAKQLVQSTNSGNVYIVPALELTKAYDTTDWADQLVAAPDPRLVKAGLGSGVLQMFYSRWKPGHQMTRFDLWQNATDADYNVTHSYDSEPYLMGATYKLPWFDERYRGWGKDKIQHAANVNYEGFKFWVLHDAYTIHRPHPYAGTMVKSTRHSVHKTKSGNLTMNQIINRMYGQQTKLFNSGKQGWKAPIDKQLDNCIHKLPWWPKAQKAVLPTATKPSR